MFSQRRFPVAAHDMVLHQDMHVRVKFVVHTVKNINATDQCQSRLRCGVLREHVGRKKQDAKQGSKAMEVSDHDYLSLSGGFLRAL